MHLIAYVLLNIYAIVGLTLYYIECLPCLLLLRVNFQSKQNWRKLNEDLLQPSGIRYVSRSFSVRCCISLAYWEGIDFYGYLVCCGTPQAIGSFLHNRIGDHTREFLVISFGDFVHIQSSLTALISLFLSRVWGNFSQ